jgi:3-isopropylmalate dehydratase
MMSSRKLLFSTKAAAAGGPQTLFDKIWHSHVVESLSKDNTTCLLYVDRHLVHEVTSPQAFEGLRLAKRKVRRTDCTIATPDHNVTTSRERLTGGKIGDDAESLVQLAALEKNVKEFGVPYFSLKDKRQGIVHVVGPEQGLTQPGQIIVCGDSHTSTHGAFGALAFGIGSSEVEHVLATQTITQQKGRNMRIMVDGKLSEHVSGKDLILHIISQIGTAGGNGSVIEFAGSAVRNLSMEGRMSMTNMTIEGGARAGLVAPDQVTLDYLKGRPFSPTGEFWDRACEYWLSLPSDPGARFDSQVDLDAKDVSPSVSWGTNPEQTVPVTGIVPDPTSVRDSGKRVAYERALEYMGLKAGTKMTDIKIDAVFIGSCTNGRIEDLRAAAKVAKGKKVHESIRAMVVPGSGLVKEQAEKEGVLQVLRDSGFDVREPGCSMCLGMNGDQLKPGERCASTSNRNFEGRQGRGGRTHLLSPAMASAAAIAGHIVDVRSFGSSRRAFSTAAPAASSQTTTGRIPWSGAMEKFIVHRGVPAHMPRPNIDTDEIIPAAHLKTIKKKGLGFAAFEKQRYKDTKCDVANPDFVLNQAKFKSASIIVAGENFGCGSSREHAPWAMLDYGIRVVIAPSFADIFYNNSCKNGLLPVILDDPKVVQDAKEGKEITVDLIKQVVVRSDGVAVPFKIDATRRQLLLDGLDEIGVTLISETKIAAYEKMRREKFPWL